MVRPSQGRNTAALAFDQLAETVTDEFARLSPDLPVPGSAEDAVSDASVRDLFLELLVLAMANLYNKTPLGSTLFDRASIRAVTGHLPDNEAGKLVNKAEDWIRHENLVRAQEGQKSYSLTREALATLSTDTGSASLGQLMERASACYVRQIHSPQLRRTTRKLAAAFLNQLGKA